MPATRFINKSDLKLIKAGSFKEFIFERDSAVLESDAEDREVKARIKIQKAILWININRGFFGQLLSNLNIYGSSDPKYPTMATNGFNIRYHPDFVLSQSDASIRFVLCHEVLHCVGEHMSRRGNRNLLLWNWATDYAINPILNSESDNNFAWPKNPDGSRMGLYEAKYEGMRAEDIYDDITKDPEAQKELDKQKPNCNFGEVVDADQELGEPDSDASVAQETFGDEEEQGQPGSGAGDQPSDETGDDGETSIIGKKVRVTEGPDAGRIGTVKQVLPNGDIIIE